MNKIIKGLKQAVRYARGDRSEGRLTVIEIPRESDLQKAKRGAGKWIKAGDVNPHTNVYGRVVRTTGGSVCVYYPSFPIENVEAWFFPAPE